MARKAGSLVIFVVDASGSMAMNRMQAAKGSAISLLAEAYKCRDQIALIGFREDTAEVLLPPTKSIAMARRRLEGLPCGGGSPLAHALQLAMRTGINAVKKSSGTLGKVVVVLITDGRANIALSESLGEEFNPENDENCTDGHPSREYLKEEVLALAKIMGSLPDFNLLCIDTEKKFLSTGLAKEIAACARGKYYPLPKGVDRQSVATITSEAMQQ
jgi:magnesium chelatase subunit D